MEDKLDSILGKTDSVTRLVGRLSDIKNNGYSSLIYRLAAALHDARRIIESNGDVLGIDFTVIMRAMDLAYILEGDLITLREAPNLPVDSDHSVMRHRAFTISEAKSSIDNNLRELNSLVVSIDSSISSLLRKLNISRI